VRRLRWAGFVLVVVAISAGCGGSKPKPLGLDQRLMRDGDLKGFTLLTPHPKPLDTLAALSDVGGDFINDPNAAAKRLVPKFQKAGFRRGLSQKLFRNGVRADATYIVSQWASEKQAKAVLEPLYMESFAPCPRKCQVKKTEFKVSGIKDAKGAELSQDTGSNRFRAYRVEFTDGPFLYGLAVYLHGPLDAVSEDDVVDAADALYKRVKDHPPPGS
jgi:hypothetical protein